MADPVASFLEREQGIFGELEATPAPIPTVTEPAPQTNGINGVSDFGELEMSNSSVPIVSNGRAISPAASERSDGEPVFQSKPDFEPESVQKWRESYEKNLKKLDEEEKKIIEELKVQAKKELDDFEKKRKTDLEDRKKANRAKQVEFLKNVEKASAGVLWQRIAKIVEEDEKTPKNVVDTDRMRELLVQCKDGGPKPNQD
ncbi:hypothetical protein FO519_008114 [Halicephalobus sp. NKZ332]|nr:hypothetical protein FO519_008114 [Halicephalobus sp. NKZ332]